MLAYMHMRTESCSHQVAILATEIGYHKQDSVLLELLHFAQTKESINNIWEEIFG